MATQKELGVHLDLSTRRIRELTTKGVLPSSKGKGGYDLDMCRIAYIGYLRGLGSGQVKRPPSESDVPEEASDYQALLDFEKYRKAKRENDLADNTVAPVEVLVDALQKITNTAVPHLESLPLNIKRHWPEITGDQITLVKKAIAEVCNDIAKIEIKIEDG